MENETTTNWFDNRQRARDRWRDDHQFCEFLLRGGYASRDSTGHIKQERSNAIMLAMLHAFEVGCDYGARVVVSPDAESVKSIDVSPAMDEDRDNGQEGSPSNEPGWMSRWDKWNKR